MKYYGQPFHVSANDNHHILSSEMITQGEMLVL